ncbi:MFS transporter [Saccharospirillum impatiens]|uniref:MFS transporter n=1 Tax=Saccharospirillum impatiens TaxID=169438 RepID=UPI000419A329|nr:MFS transporter [Saccharospirillum impatiens]
MTTWQRITRTRSLIPTVLACHFLTSFTALGMPVFLPKLMEGLLLSGELQWIGWFYSLPLVCMALSAPLWGWFADRYGKRLSLMRAQVGLAAGFLIIGLSDSLLQFTVGLVLQGLCGGTFAASNAYLASQIRPSLLPTAQNWMQVSARSSLLVAPIILGLLIGNDEPRRLFIYLALLPLAALLMTRRLPRDQNGHSQAMGDKQLTDTASPVVSRATVSAIQFCFYFATVVTYPYFLPWANQLGVQSATTVGFLFSLPHLCYLMLMVFNVAWVQKLNALVLCQVSFLCLLIASLQQAQMDQADGLVLWRLLTGLSLFLGFLGLHKLIADLNTVGTAGRLFGWFDSVGKWSAVAAGILSGMITSELGLASTFYLSAAMILVAWCLVAGSSLPKRSNHS